MRVAIIDYGSGNLRSAAKAFERSIRESGRSDSVRVTNSAEEAAAADRLVLPGVGAFADCRSGLDNLDGMVEALEEAIIVRGKPFLGICVGMQLLANISYENGEHKGLGWIDGQIKKLPTNNLKLPHMGWNEVEIINNNKLIEKRKLNEFH